MKRSLEMFNREYIGETLESGGLNLKIIEKPRYPNILFKYFGVTKCSVDAITSFKLYANHPDQFNDMFDCHQNLVKKLNPVLQARICSMIDSLNGAGYSKDFSEQELINQLHILHYMRVGVISFTEDPYNILMWSYYGNNRGFMVAYDSKKLPKSFHGPFRVDYQKVLEPISEDDISPEASLLYTSTIKSIAWSHEKEWRILAESDDKLRPLFLPPKKSLTEKTNLHSRLFKLDKETVLSISLGHKFFDQSSNELTKSHTTKDGYEVNIPIDDRSRLLDFIIEHNLKLFHVRQLKNSMEKIDLAECSLERVSQGKYRLEFLKSTTKS